MVKKTRNFFKKNFLLVTSLMFLVVFSGTMQLFAADPPPPVGGYPVGSGILDPGCTPGSANCIVAQAVYNAGDIVYDNLTSGLTATDVQGAIDEIDGVVDGMTLPVYGDPNAVLMNDGAGNLSWTKVLNLSGDQNVSGVKTFTDFPILPSSAPTDPYQAVNKSYVDTFALGMSVRGSVQAATTAAGTLASDFEEGDTLDTSYTLVAGDRILIKNQADGKENGIYTVNASGAPTRATDYDEDSEVGAGTFTTVLFGTANANTQWVQTTATPTIGVSSLIFSKLSTQSTAMQIGGGITSATQGSVLFTGASGVLSQNNSKLFWDNTNNRLGIGTNSPETALTVITGEEKGMILRNSTAGASTVFEAQNTNPLGQAGFIFLNDRGGRSYGGLIYGGSNIGAPASNLFGSDRRNKLFLFADGTENLGMYFGTLRAQPVVFGTNNTENMRILSGGNVGIGTATPERKLHIKGDAFLIERNANDPAIIWRNTLDPANPTQEWILGARVGTSPATDNLIYAYRHETDHNPNTVVMTLTKTGEVGIGTSTPTYNLSVENTSTSGIVGSFTNADGTCTLDPGDIGGWSCLSDRNLKKDINNLELGLLELNQLRPVTYRLINEDESTDLSIGLIAQEVEPVFPKLVKTQKDGTLTLNYGGLTPVMIKAIQELDLKVEDLILEKQNLFSNLISWFGNVENGIEKLFTKEIHTEMICVKKSDGAERCITGDELDQVLSNTGVNNITSAQEPAEEDVVGATGSVEDSVSGEVQNSVTETPQPETPPDNTPATDTTNPTESA